MKEVRVLKVRIGDEIRRYLAIGGFLFFCFFLLTIMFTNKSRMINHNTRIVNWFDLGTKIQKLIEEI